MFASRYNVYNDPNEIFNGFVHTIQVRNVLSPFLALFVGLIKKNSLTSEKAKQILYFVR